MRLAVFTNQFPGPVSTFFARDMRGLIDAGIDVEVFPIYPCDTAHWQYVPDVLNEKVLPRNKFHHLTFGECVRTVRLWPSKKIWSFLRDTLYINTSAVRYGPEPLLKSNYVLLKACAWARRFGDNYDHVLAYWGNYAATSAYLFHRLTNPAMPFSLFLHAGLDLYRNPVFMRQKLLYADNIITCSDFNNQFIRFHYSDIADRLTEKIYVHHHGLDLSEFAFQENGRLPRKVIAVGRMEKEKGFDYLIRAAHELKTNGLEIDLEFVGNGPEAACLKSLAHELGIKDRVTFRGWVTPDEVRKIMQQSRMLVHPSAYLGDGVPNVIKECMAIGTPVVATKVAGIPEVLGQGKYGFLVPPQDVSALANAIETVLVDEVGVNNLIDAARKYVEEKFDLRANGLKLAEVLSGQIDRHASSKSRS